MPSGTVAILQLRALLFWFGTFRAYDGNTAGQGTADCRHELGGGEERRGERRRGGEQHIRRIEKLGEKLFEREDCKHCPGSNQCFGSIGT